ncbi:RecB family exonuclease [Bernardetia litoralis DSM 6794]|uniref:RecB family exonuclease n=1 Tax=Bernardetia litoralis (strain ATCC 23117 / DSM 6794 / NBRC 15988 / NCIMB 1366 / Fx l1 / Sio-4) TaxID=880071 RepID=I4AL07_BERLS|nr:PD-(D/E)XK nuclease family protein [Bernardetia litoralis]AFM04642.1 RecB family exonuclease [Bernardetia litoralis DSM 6794]
MSSPVSSLSFLQKVATKLYQEWKTDISDLHIVLPTRRACLYFKTFLSEIADETIFSPKVISLEDFIVGSSGLEIEDTSTLVFELYDSYQRFDKAVAGSLERFAPMAITMLSDFNLIDRNLVKSHELFEYLDEVKTMERWGEMFGDAEQDSTISNLSKIQEYYLFWENVEKTYNHFREKLESSNRAYSGLAFRWVYENLEQIIEDQRIECAVFVGFNQLYKAEELIIQKLEKLGKAKTYWDMDAFYIDAKWHEAGNYFRKFLQNGFIKGRREEVSFIENLIQTEKKEIEVISVVNTITQAKTAGHLLNEMIEKLVYKNEFFKFSQARNHTAVLLPDETMLLPMLYSLPKSSEGVNIQKLVNITMGVSLKNTPLFSLIKNLFQAQENMLRDEEQPLSVYHKDLQRILQHPYIRPMEEDENPPLKRMHDENIIYFSVKELSDYKINGWLYGQLFEDWGKNERNPKSDDTDTGNIHKALRSFFKIIEALAHRFTQAEFSLESEYLFEFYKLLKQVERMIITYAPNEETHIGNSIFGEIDEELSQKLNKNKSKSSEKQSKKTKLKIPLKIESFERLLLELMRDRKIPFTGEPIAPIQIMGMLESRALDFENVIIISANEGIFPRGKVLNSSIPFDIRLQFKLPTHTEDDAAYSYNFYRLLQRSKKITLIYASDMEGMRGGEPSRYVNQIKSELAHLENISFYESRLELPLPTFENSTRIVEKTPAIIQRLEKYLTQEGLSPSYISRYLEEPMRFYEKKVLKLNEPPMMEEDLFQHTYGQVMHEALEELFEPLVGKEINEEWLDKTRKDKENLKLLVEKLITKLAGGVMHDTGKNFLLKEVTQSLIPEFMRLQKEEAPIRLIALEQQLKNTITFDIKIDGQIRKIPLKLIGTADRIDIITTKEGIKRLQVIDYKTGKMDAAALKADTFEQLLSDEKAKIIQLVLYKYLFIKTYQAGQIKHLPTDFSLEEYQIVSGFWFFRKLSSNFTPYHLKAEKDLTLDGFLAEVETFLQKVVENMLDAAIPFSDVIDVDIWEEEVE